MKKTLAILVAILLVALSITPAFAESVDSPRPTKANYQITIVPGSGGGGNYDFDFVTPVDDNGKQTVHFIAKPDDGYEFKGWTFEGDYTTIGNLTDLEIDLIVSGDIKATPVFAKKGETTPTTPATPAKTDTSTKSPKTGANDYVFAGIALLAVMGLLVVARKRHYK